MYFFCLQCCLPLTSLYVQFWDMGDIKEKNMYIFQFEKVNASDVCCLFWKKKKNGEKHKIKYFLTYSIVSGLLLNLFTAPVVSFVSQHQEQWQEYMAIRLIIFHNSASDPTPLTSAAHSTQANKQAAALFFSLVQPQEVAHSSLPSVCLMPWVHIGASRISWQSDYENSFFFPLCGAHMKPLHLLAHSCLHCSNYLPRIYCH